jgi:hypothetical protein
MPVAALVASARAAGPGGTVRRGPALLCAALGLGCIVGVLIEPVTYGRRQRAPAVRAATALDLVSSAALTATALRCVAVPLPRY